MITNLKSHLKALGFSLQKDEKIDFSNEVLNNDFWQEAAKISEVKVGGRKKHLPISPVQAHAPQVSRVGRYFIQLLRYVIMVQNTPIYYIK